MAEGQKQPMNKKGVLIGAIVFCLVMAGYFLFGRETAQPAVMAAPAVPSLLPVTPEAFGEAFTASGYTLEWENPSDGEAGAFVALDAPLVASGAFSQGWPCVLYFSLSDGHIQKMTMLLQRPMPQLLKDVKAEPKQAKGEDAALFNKEWRQWKDTLDYDNWYQSSAKEISGINAQLLQAALSAMDSRARALKQGDLVTIASAFSLCEENAKQPSLAYPPYFIEISATKLGADHIMLVTLELPAKQ